MPEVIDIVVGIVLSESMFLAALMTRDGAFTGPDYALAVPSADDERPQDINFCVCK